MEKREEGGPGDSVKEGQRPFERASTPSSFLPHSNLTGVLSDTPTIPSNGVIFTMGAGDFQLAHLSRRLEYRDVSHVIDVRTPPFALTRMDVTPDPLAAHLGERGIRYLNLSESLGDRPRDVSVFVQGTLDPERFWSRPWAQEGLTRLFNAYQQGFRVALLDRDDDLLSSHRARCLGAWLWRQGIEPRHITKFDSEMCQRGVETRLRALGFTLPPHT